MKKRNPDEPLKRVNRKWKPVFLVEIYKLAKLGMAKGDIANTLKISRTLLFYWEKNRPEVKLVFAMVAKELSDGETFQDWIYNQLSPELKELWDNIKLWEKEPSGVVKIELMLQDQGKLVRQQLFLHALCVSNFSVNFAMRRVNISKRTLDEWMSRDIDFSELISQIEWYKGNFFENSLIRLVKQGHPAAILFANRTFNRERGYAPKSEVEVNVNGNILHGVLDLSVLMPYMREDTKNDVMAAIRQYEESKVLSKTAKPRLLDLQEVVSEQISNSLTEE